MFCIAQFLFRKKLFLNVLAILQLALCLGLTNYIYGLNNHYYNGYNDTFKFDNASIFKSTTGLTYSYFIDKESFEATNSQIEYIYHSVKADKYLISFYGEKTLHNYESYLITKKIEDKTDSNVINCFVVGDKSLLNSVITIKIGTQYNFYVCGVLSPKTKRISDNTDSSYLTPGDVFVDFDKNLTNIICIDKGNESLHHNQITIAAMVYYGQKSQAEKMISKFGTLYTMSELRDNVDYSSDGIVQRVFYHVSYGTGILAFLSILCISILNINDSKEEFLTFKSTGIKPFHILVISSIYTLIFNICLLPLSAFVFYLSKTLFGINISPLLGINNLFFTLLVIVITFAINICISYFMLFKQSDKI